MKRNKIYFNYRLRTHDICMKRPYYTSNKMNCGWTDLLFKGLNKLSPEQVSNIHNININGDEKVVKKVSSVIGAGIGTNLLLQAAFSIGAKAAQGQLKTDKGILNCVSDEAVGVIKAAANQNVINTAIALSAGGPLGGVLVAYKGVSTMASFVGVDISPIGIGSKTAQFVFKGVGGKFMNLIRKPTVTTGGVVGAEFATDLINEKTVMVSYTGGHYTLPIEVYHTIRDEIAKNGVKLNQKEYLDVLSQHGTFHPFITPETYGYVSNQAVKENSNLIPKGTESSEEQIGHIGEHIDNLIKEGKTLLNNQEQVLEQAAKYNESIIVQPLQANINIIADMASNPTVITTKPINVMGTNSYSSLESVREQLVNEFNNINEMHRIAAEQAAASNSMYFKLAITFVGALFVIGSYFFITNPTISSYTSDSISVIWNSNFMMKNRIWITSLFTTVRIDTVDINNPVNVPNFNNVVNADVNINVPKDIVNSLNDNIHIEEFIPDVVSNDTMSNLNKDLANIKLDDIRNVLNNNN